MSKKKKELKKLEVKILSLLKNSPQSTFNYKQLAAKLNVRDTKGRNNIIRVLNLLQQKKYSFLSKEVNTLIINTV